MGTAGPLQQLSTECFLALTDKCLSVAGLGPSREEAGERDPAAAPEAFDEPQDPEEHEPRREPPQARPPGLAQPTNVKYVKGFLH